MECGLHVVMMMTQLCRELHVVRQQTIPHQHVSLDNVAVARRAIDIKIVRSKGARLKYTWGQVKEDLLLFFAWLDVSPVVSSTRSIIYL